MTSNYWAGIWQELTGRKGQRLLKLPLFFTGICLSLLISAQWFQGGVAQNSPSTIRIGYQKYGTVSIVKAKGDLEKQLKAQNISVQWSLFPGGPQLLEALNAGSIDFGHTGEAPPIFAQAAGAPLVYVGNEAPNPKGEAILVHQDSNIKTVADLKGKKVALNKGSNVHFLLVKALESAKVKYGDITTVFLPPADGRAAFESKKVDAWVIWDPFYEAGKRATNARVLRDGEGLVANREFYLASRSLLKQSPNLVKTVLSEINKVDKWAAANHNQVATLLSPELGIDVPTLEAVSRRRPYGVKPVTQEVIAYQQNVANTFQNLGLLKQAIAVKDATDPIAVSLVSK